MSKQTVECCKHLHSKQTVNVKIKLIIVVHSKNFKGGRPCINLLILIVIIISTFYSHRLFSLTWPYIFPLSLHLSLFVYLIICMPVPTRVEFSLLSSSSSSITSFYSLLQLQLSSLPLPCSPSCFSQSPLSVLYILYFLIFLFNPILPLVLFVRFPFSSFLELNPFSQLKGHLSCNVFLRLPTNFSSRREGWFSYR